MTERGSVDVAAFDVDGTLTVRDCGATAIG